MKVHPRRTVVTRAQNELTTFVLDLQQRHDLTDIEFLIITNSVAGTTLKYMLRAERHPNEPDKPADEE